MQLLRGGAFLEFLTSGVLFSRYFKNVFQRIFKLNFVIFKLHVSSLTGPASLIFQVAG